VRPNKPIGKRGITSNLPPGTLLKTTDNRMYVTQEGGMVKRLTPKVRRKKGRK
jgi:hypothetical protein